ncbi:WD40 repeat domain-containing protein [Roseibium aquae]
MDGFIVRAGFLKGVPFFVSGSGPVRFIGAEPKVLTPHDGGVLAAEITKDGNSLITSGDDGKIMQSDLDGNMVRLAERPRKWIDVLACGPSGAVAFASGRAAWVRLADGTEKEFQHERAVGGLAFAPKGLRLAVARYDGATLWWVNTSGKPVELGWKGAHLDIAFSPEGKYLVTTMQENALHGWRLADSQDMRMTGYPAKVKSWSWSVKGRHLATAGASAAIVWPFTGKTGPMGQTPLQLGVRGDSLVTCVACHPKEEVVAIGYADGMIMMVRFQDNAEVLLKRPGAGPISTLAWDTAGMRIAFGSEEAEAGVIDLQG